MIVTQVKRYNGSTWVDYKLSVSAENVFFPEDITYTENIGAIKLPTGQTFGTLKLSEMNLKTLTQKMFAETKAPTITQPSYSLSANGITTDTGNWELGSKITKVTWNGTYIDGKYSYGYKNADGSVNTSTAANCVASYKITNNSDDQTSTSLDGNFTLKTPIEVNSESSKTYVTVTSICSWLESTRTPVNNIGEAVDGKIAAGSSTKTANFSGTGYREGFFVGYFTAKTTEFTSALLRDSSTITKSKKKYSAGDKEYTIPVGAATVVIACPKSKTGVTKVLNATVNADMTTSFGTPITVSIEGANGYTAVDYNVWAYSPAEAYGIAADLVITLG